MKTIKGKKYRVTKQTGRTCSIDYYVADCSTIWPRDAKRPVSDLVYHVIAHASKLGEALRRERYEDAAHELGRLSIWFFSFMNKLGKPKNGTDLIITSTTTLSEIIWNRFPNCCPACFGREYAIPKKRGKPFKRPSGRSPQPCTCLLSLASVETRNQKYSHEEKAYINRELAGHAKKHLPKYNSKVSLDELQDRFAKIFSSNLFVTPIESIGFHLLEEVGEVCEAISGLYDYKNKKNATQDVYHQKVLDLESEIADVFSWIFSLTNKLRDIFSLPDRHLQKMFPDAPAQPQFGDMITLSQIIWQTYGNKDNQVLGCRDCHDLVCTCATYPIEDEEKAKELLEKL